MDSIWGVFMKSSGFAALLFTFCWGLSGVVKDWSDTLMKLINVLLIIGCVVMFFLIGGRDYIGSSITGLIACYLSAYLGSAVGEAVDDGWKDVAAIIGLISFIAMFVLYGFDI